MPQNTPQVRPRRLDTGPNIFTVILAFIVAAGLAGALLGTVAR